MPRSHRAILLVLTTVACAGLWQLPALGRPYAGLPAWDGAPRFEADRAWADAETLATRFPRRWSGSADRAAAADWLAASMQRIGLDVNRASFTAFLGPPESVLLENVWGESRGIERPDEVIVAMGNYDMAPTSYQAASDTAGHVGTLLELARLIHAAPHRRTIIFLFPDGEEWGMLGARHFARTFPGRGRIVAALSIEDLDAGPLRALGIDGIGQGRGFAPMWLRALAADAAAREDLAVDEVPALFEWLQRSVAVSATDQGPFLGEGIPAIDLAGRGADRVLQDRIYHLPGDIMEHMQRRSFHIYGRVQERILRTLDGLPSVPREPDAYLRLGPDRVVPAGPLTAVQVAVFLPLVAAVVLGLRRGGTWAGYSREVIALGLVLGVLLGGLVVIKALPRLGLMPAFELYPPPPRHPLLTQVDWSAMAIAAGATAALALIAWRGFYRLPPLRPREAGSGVTVLLLALLVTSAAALLDNPFGAVTFLLLPVLLWVWVEPARSAARGVLNAGLVVLGFLTIVALIVQYAQALRIGPYILWYLSMSAASGQFTTLRLVLALMTIAIGARLIAVGSPTRP
jgi:hypothetical protein